MQEMTMVERVAREIATSDFDGDKIWDDLSFGLKTSYMYNARAAIEAMRTPTNAMIAEGNAHDDRAPYDIYESMIDAALSE